MYEYIYKILIQLKRVELLQKVVYLSSSPDFTPSCKYLKNSLNVACKNHVEEPVLYLYNTETCLGKA